MKRLGTAILLLLFITAPMLAQAQAQGQAWGNRRELVRAEYGWRSQWTDVTDRVVSLIRNDSLNFRVDNHALGFDPAPGRDKTLRLYLRNKQGRTQMVRFAEDSNVRLQRIFSNYQTADYNDRDLRVLRATYGYGGRSVDVTNRLQRQIYNDRIDLRVTNESMGGDPAVGEDKVLTVMFSVDGRRDQVVVREGDYLRLSGDGGYGPGGSYGRDLQILRATYGYGSRSFDVTDRLQRQVYNDQIDLRVTNESMGGDPAVGADKTLTVQFSADGRRDQVVVREGDYLRLSGSGVGSGGGDYNRDLQILRATYGYGSRSFDVTDRLQRQVFNDQIDLRVTNESMGGDPAVGADKTLTVQFSVDGRRDQVVVREGDYLRLSGSGAGYGGGNPYDRDLQILRASYGYGGRSFDVAGRLQREVRNGQLDLRVTNESMGGDPAVGEEKTLTVQYSFNGRTSQVSVREGDYVRLPNSDIGYPGGSALIPRGTELKIRTNESIDSRNTGTGQTFSATVEEDVRDGSGNVAIQRRSDAALVIRSTSGNDLVLDIDSLSVGGERYYVSTEDVQRGGRSGRRTAVMVGGGAVAGAIIGAILGGGKGAAIGAGVGAGAGAVGTVLTSGKEVRVPAETVLTFRLDQDLRLGY